MLKKIFILILISQKIFAQNSTFKISGYAETYYAFNSSVSKGIYGFDKNKMQNHIYNYNRHNEVNLNLGLVSIAYANNNVRGNVGLMAGTYSNANLSSEPNTLKNIYEANVGMMLKNNVWLDAGILPSHIGLESAIGKDNLTLTRSVAADNSPYFETGIRLSKTFENKKWYAAILLLNGWQNITRTSGVQSPSIGTQITYTPNSLLKINYSNYIGQAVQDRFRIYNNIYSTYQINKKWQLAASFDYGADKKTSGLQKGENYNWYTAVIMAQLKLNAQHQLSMRAEIFNDPYFIMLASNYSNCKSFSCNYDYNISTDASIRIEPKYVISNSSDVAEKNYFIFTTAMCLKLN
jgi:hypothetical protein